MNQKERAQIITDIQRLRASHTAMRKAYPGFQTISSGFAVHLEWGFFHDLFNGAAVRYRDGAAEGYIYAFADENEITFIAMAEKRDVLEWRELIAESERAATDTACGGAKKTL